MSFMYWMLAACGSFMVSFGLNLMFSTPGNLSILQILSHILLMPLIEEVIFRFGIMKLGYKLTKNFKAVMIVQVVLFSLWHIPSLPNVIYAALMAYVFGVLYRKFGKLDAPYLAHAAANAAAVVRVCSTILLSPEVIMAGTLAFCMGFFLLFYLLLLLRQKPDAACFSRKSDSDSQAGT